MKKHIQAIAAKIGMDKAIFYTAFARVFQGVGGIVSVLLVASFLTGIEQGFYYTFASILAIQVFFELGLGTIITQFVAHEKAHLTEQNNAIVGDEKYRSRLAYLLKFCVKWYSILSVFLLVLLSAVGVVFFTCYYKSDVAVQWQIPWILLVAGTALNFIAAPISAYLEGLGKVKEVAFMRLLQQIISQTAVWLGLIAGLKLYVVFLAPFILVTIFIIFTWCKFGKLLVNIYHTKISEKISYRQEIFPYQWKIALSWISGYFIFQLFNPVIFATEGAVAAGQMGMTLTALTAILNLSMSWVYTKIPAMSSLISIKDYVALDKNFITTLRSSTIVNLSGLILFFFGLIAIRLLDVQINGTLLANRFLPYIPVALLMISTFSNQVVGAWAVYLRCHKQEPMMIQSIVIASLCTVSTFVAGKFFGVMGITTGYAVICIVSLVWTYFIFTNKKKAWHNE